MVVRIQKLWNLYRHLMSLQASLYCSKESSGTKVQQNSNSWLSKQALVMRSIRPC